MNAQLKQVTKSIHNVGDYDLFMLKAFSTIKEALSHRPIIFKQMVRIGVESIPVVLLASCFAGVVTTLQAAYQLEQTFLSEQVVWAVVVPTLMLEMAALLPGLVLASRVGASIAAELGTMKVTEQIDALEAMGLNSIAFLVLPRVIAGIFMFPSLYVASALVSILAGGWSADFLGLLPMESFIQGARAYFLPFDAFYGASKALAFGFLITSISCWKGFNARGGAQGVGSATTQAVVVSCISILIADYILAEILL